MTGCRKIFPGWNGSGTVYLSVAGATCQILDKFPLSCPANPGLKYTLISGQPLPINGVAKTPSLKIDIVDTWYAICIIKVSKMAVSCGYKKIHC